MASFNGTPNADMFDPFKWTEKFVSAKHGVRKQMRIEIMEGTLEACKNFGYTSLDGHHISLGDHSSISNEVKKTRLYVEQHPPIRAPEEAELVTSIRVENRDCLEEAILLKAQGLNPAVLNMASPKRPGLCVCMCSFVCVCVCVCGKGGGGWMGFCAKDGGGCLGEGGR